MFQGLIRRVSGQDQRAYNRVQIEDTTGTDALGLVTASPAANTLLARLKDLLTGIILAAGEAHVGAVGGHTVTLQQTPTVSTSPAYTAGDAIGGKISFTSAVRAASPGSGMIHSIGISDLAKQDSAIDIIFFSADPSGTTFTDNTALDIADADLTKIIGIKKLVATDYSDFADNACACVGNVGLPFKLASGTTLYACLIARGTPTFASTNDITVTLGVFQD